MKYPDHNLISIGDHCAIPLILRDLGLRKKSYPFDWVAHTALLETNIVYNINTILSFSSESIDNIVEGYIGDAFSKSNKINSKTSIVFPHDHNHENSVFEKYKRRFIRLKEDLPKKNIFFLLTRVHYINEDNFLHITNTLLSYNPDSFIIFISGTDHPYIEGPKFKNVIFKYIYYNVLRACDFDYDTFRPKIKEYLKELLF